MDSFGHEIVQITSSLWPQRAIENLGARVRKHLIKPQSTKTLVERWRTCLVFGTGTIVGMMLITAATAVPIAYSTRFQLLHRHLGTAAGVISLRFGLFLVYRIGFVDRLFR